MSEIISFDSMTPAEQQAWADFTLHEIERHIKDISRGIGELKLIRQKYGIKPRSTYFGKWVDVA